MTEKELLDGLKILTSLYGAASVAVSLKYKTQRTIELWLKNERIPRARRPAVKNFIELEIAKGTFMKKPKPIIKRRANG